MEYGTIVEEIEKILTSGAMKVLTPETTGQRIYWLRRHGLKIQQKELAARLETSQGFLSEVESDKKEPGSVFLVKVADILNTTTDFLLLRTDNPAIPGDEKPTFLSEEAEAVARMVDDMPPEGRESALRSVTGIYGHYQEHAMLDKQIMELLSVIEQTRGSAFRRDLERRLGLTSESAEDATEPLSL